MSRLYDWYEDRWQTRGDQRAWKDPVWAAIEARRDTGRGDDSKLWMSDEDGLGWEEWDTQQEIWDRLTPPTPMITVHRWLKRYGVKVNVRRARRFVQRGWRGWADEDVWNLNGYLAKVITGSVQNLRDITHGHPAEFTEQEWDAILAKIIGGFQAVLDDWADHEPDDDRSRFAARTARFDEACELFRTWYRHLDD